MKTRNRFTIYTLIGLGIFLLAGSCKKDSASGDNTSSGGIIFNGSLTYGTVTDIDGNVYKTITIGTQTWMAENLRVSRYRNGDSISNIHDNAAWNQQSGGAWCYYYNDEKKGATYGKLYNWIAIKDPRSICPTGWHIPTDAEWETLYSFLGGYQQTTSDKLRETGITHWAYINDGATNESGFTAIPGGMRDYGGLFTDYGQTGFWWSSTPAGDYYNMDAVYYYLDQSGVSMGTGDRRNGMAVRCVKD